MGNRAVITIEKSGDDDVGIYVHWNGGPESILAFCECARRLEARDPTNDPQYCLGKLVTIIGNFLSNVGVGKLRDLDCDNGNNGLYYLSEGFKIVGRKHNGTDPRTTVEELSPSETERYRAILRDCLLKNHAPGKLLSDLEDLELEA